MRGYAGIAKVLIAHGADVNAPSIASGLTPLMAATSILKSVDIINVLLEHGAKVNDSAKKGMTALLMAAAFGNVPAIDTLLAHGADAKATDGHGWTALMAAAGHGHPEAVADLVGHGADVAAKSNDGKTAADLVCSSWGKWQKHSCPKKKIIAALASAPKR